MHEDLINQIQHLKQRIADARELSFTHLDMVHNVLPILKNMELVLEQPRSVTCQTYGHVVGACAECNTHEEAYQASIATPQPQSVHVISDSHDVYVAVSQAVAGQLIYIRDKLLLEDIQEAYHALYCIADPNLTSTEPWKRLEDIAASKAIIEHLSATTDKDI